MSNAIHVPAARLADQLIERGERPGADRGHPQVHAMDLADHAGMRAGVWACTAGGWPVSDRPDLEICLVLEGQATITDDDDTSFTVKAGDLLVLPVGWSGRWDVEHAVRKIFIALPDGARGPALTHLDSARETVGD